MKKKIIMGLFVLTAVIGMGFAETKTKSNNYYRGYIQATSDYSNDNAYNPSWCINNSSRATTGEQTNKNRYDCIQGYEDSWTGNSNAAPKTQTENTSEK